MTGTDSDRYLRATRNIFHHIARVADLRCSIRLWDGTLIPLGDDVEPDVYISIRDPGVLGRVLPPWKMS